MKWLLSRAQMYNIFILMLVLLICTQYACSYVYTIDNGKESADFILLMKYAALLTQIFLIYKL